MTLMVFNRDCREFEKRTQHRSAFGNQIHKVQLSTGQVVTDTFVGTHLRGAATHVSEGAAG